MNKIEIQNKACPVRDYISVEMMNAPPGIRAVRYDICRDIYSSLNHIAYQPAVGHSLRHAVLFLHAMFYRYVVPNGTVAGRGILKTVQIPRRDAFDT